MKTILFSPAAYNLAETTRCIEVAKAIQHKFECVFIAYGGQFEQLVEEEGFTLIKLEPRLTEDKIEHLYKVDQGKKLGHLFSVDELRQRVDHEVAVMERLKPKAVVTGFNLANNISARVAGVPLVWLSHSTWEIKRIFDEGLGDWTDMLDIFPLNKLPEKTLRNMTMKLIDMVNYMTKPYNKLLEAYNVDFRYRNMEAMFRGDYNLLAEPKGFSGLDFPESYHFVSPLIARLDKALPPELDALDKSKPLVYFAMGSSGRAEVVKQVIEGFAGQPFQVIAPVKRLLKDTPVRIPDNVIVTDYLPAHIVNPMADVSVIHGGVGTVMTACLAGKPVVGVGMMFEQEANIDAVVRLGFGERIRVKRLNAQTLNQAIDRMLHNETAKKKAAAFSEEVKQAIEDNSIERFFVSTF